MGQSAIRQHPSPGSRQLLFCGDTITFCLQVPPSWSGRAGLRTTMGHAREVRREIIRQVALGEPPLGHGWYDIPMRLHRPGEYRLTLALTEVGHFEAKGYYLPEDDQEPLWPHGGNTYINVSPAHSCCANIVYNAFVRQFGSTKQAQTGSHQPSSSELDAAGYTVIPPSGTFRDLIGELDFIIGRLGCRYLQLLPIHPTPTTYARMGRFGSPYAALSFTAVDPSLAAFDPAATPLEQFIELVDAVHARRAYLILDMAINHTGWAASLHETHPGWLARESGGRIENPGAWGVVWADLTRLDYSHQDLWQYMAEVFLTWCRRGVDGFRCDAGYMIPGKAWRYMIARVREAFPDTIFLLEGLGGKISVTRDLLDRGDFNWAYSELFQNYTRQQIEHYLPEALQISGGEGLNVHFAETHDNLRLAATSPTFARMRTALCALLSANGAFGYANGVEWLATEKINVHESASLNWGAADNLVNHLRRLAALLSDHPAFVPGTAPRLVPSGDRECVGAVRSEENNSSALLVLVNLDCNHSTEAVWPQADSPLASNTAWDLLSGETVRVESDGEHCNHLLAPGQVRCLTSREEDLARVLSAEGRLGQVPERVAHQCLRAKALAMHTHYQGMQDLGALDVDQAAGQLAADPLAFCTAMNPFGTAARTIVWQWPADLRRMVMVPPGHFLLVRAAHPFRAAIGRGRQIVAAEESLEEMDGGHFALFLPLATPKKGRERTLHLSHFGAEKTEHAKGRLRYLAEGEAAQVRKHFSRRYGDLTDLHLLGTNGRGGMCRAHAQWGWLYSRYDALLAANLHPTLPEARRILLTRLRGWLVFQDYSQEIGPDCLDRFGFDYDSWGAWQFRLPVGQGQHVMLGIAIQMATGANRLQFSFYRHPAAGHPDRLADDQPVTLILRPDLEDRDFHGRTQAFTGPENRFPAAIQARADGFAFAPYSGHTLAVETSRATFVTEPEWHYMVALPKEAQRGLEAATDLFSPGYFSVGLAGDRMAVLTARVVEAAAPAVEVVAAKRRIQTFFNQTAVWEAPQAALVRALDQYIVQRGDLSTVIAGYPWFLDWGRDTLIVARGMIAAGRHAEALAMLRQFAALERQGTIPNMIDGADTANRDTSDAPLWLIRVCAELGAVLGPEVVLNADCGGRPLGQVLVSIAEAIIAGTPNGIVMDPESALIFSPAHFTWMDTNHPAATPRQGYPIEIQALWQTALAYLATVDEEGRQGRWQQLAGRAQTAMAEHFYRPETGDLSDCLHAEPGTPAAAAVADDALRPNQLLALTLGAVTDKKIAAGVLAACQALLVPGAIRSLADRPVTHPLAIVHNGQQLVDPHYPYQGTYGGDEDTGRKPAYHNGTAWTWLFPSFCEAWAEHYGPAERATALAWLASGIELVNRGCAGHVPEILDGDAPHHPRGCDAQAWGGSELLRVWIKLQANAHNHGAQTDTIGGAP